MRYPLITGDYRMSSWKKIVFLMIPAFVLVSAFATSSYAGKKHKHWKKEKISAYKDVRNEAHGDWRDEIRYSQGHHHHDCNLPPGLAKKGKVPPGWAKKCGHRELNQHRDHKRTSGHRDKPTIQGGVDIGVGIHIPFP